MEVKKIFAFEQGWEYIEMKIMEFKRLLEESPFPNDKPDNAICKIVQDIYKLDPPHENRQMLYDKYREVYVEYISTRVVPSLRGKHGELMLTELVKRWSKYKVMMTWLIRLFFCLQHWCTEESYLPNIKEVAIACFRNQVYQEVKANARDVVINLIDKEREGEKIDRTLVMNVKDIFVEIGMGQMELYKQDFEALMLQDSGAYYSRKASNWIVDNSCPDYMLKAEECLKRERERVSQYLHKSSEQKLVEKVQHELLMVYATQLLEKEHSGCCALLRDNKVEDLSRMYRLYCKIPKGLDPFLTIFKQHVTAEGTTLMQQAMDAANSQAANGDGVQEQVLFRKIIELLEKYYFLNHSLFYKALEEALEKSCKTVTNCSIAELLATFCDNILKKGGSEKLSDEAIEDTLKKVLPYISDRDLFAELYRKKLAHRLLLNQSANKDHEKSILTKLKQQCGAQFTSKMEGMVTDLTLALENQTTFEEYLRNNTNVNTGIDLNVTVLTSRFWPSYKSFDLSLPPEMVRCVEVFKGFYEIRTKHRKLRWIYSLGTCTINGKFESKHIELIVSTSQAAALLLFNNADRLSFSEIMAQLNLTHNDVVRLLHSLSCAKYKILTKEPITSTVSATDNFEFNYKFTDKMRRIKIPLPPVEGRRRVIKDVDKDRQDAIEAAIIRIMKSQKVLGHQQLVMECVKQLSHMFKPGIKAIKKGIENLITNEFLERDKEDRKMFRYLA